jgi:8-oxo-dGTP pyrophosphatase MutT (NUDIX family)
MPLWNSGTDHVGQAAAQRFDTGTVHPGGRAACDGRLGRAGPMTADPRFWQPDVPVATVVIDGGRVLVVEERVAGRLVLNQPAGHLEPDEPIVAAAIRETREETGWDVRPTAFVGAYQWKAPSVSLGGAERTYVRFAFVAEPLHFDPSRRLDDGIVRAVWMTPAELQAAAPMHRSPLVWRVVADALAGRRFPLDLVQSLA